MRCEKFDKSFAEVTIVHSFGEYMRIKRVAKGYSLSEVCKASNCSAPFEIKVERNETQNIELNYLATLNNFLGLDFFTSLYFLDFKMPISCRPENLFLLFEDFYYRGSKIDKEKFKDLLQKSYAPFEEEICNQSLTLGGFLKQKRAKKGYLINDIASIMQVHNQFVSSLENDYPKKKYLSLLSSITEAYDLDFLFAVYLLLDKSKIAFVDMDTFISFGPHLVLGDQRIEIKRLRSICQEALE